MILEIRKSVDKNSNLETNVTQSDKQEERKLEQIVIFIISSKADKSNKEGK